MPQTAEGMRGTPAQLAAGRILARECVQLAVNVKLDTNAKSVAFLRQVGGTFISRLRLT